MRIAKGESRATCQRAIYDKFAEKVDSSGVSRWRGKKVPELVVQK